MYMFKFINNYVKIKYFLWLAFLCLNVNAQTTEVEQSSDIVSVDHALVEVNSDVILLSEFVDRRLLTKINTELARQTYTPSAISDYQILQRMVDETLQLQVAEQFGINISDTRVLQEISTISESNNMSISSFQSIFDAYGPRAFEIFRKNLKSQMILTSVYWAITRNRVRVSRQEVEQRLQISSDPSYDINYILVYSDDTEQGIDSDLVAEDISDRIVMELSSVNFTDIELNQKYGNSDNFHIVLYRDRKVKDMPTVISRSISNLEEGGISVVKNDSGFNIIQVSRKTMPNRQSVDLYKVQQIVMNANPVRDLDSTKEELLTIKNSIESSSVSFEEMSRIYSEDISNNYQGGDLGWVQLQDLPATISEVVANLQVNQISEPILFNEGWRIIRVVDVQSQPLDNEALYRQISNSIIQSRIAIEVDRWQNELRERAYIRYIDPTINDIVEIISGG